VIHFRSCGGRLGLSRRAAQLAPVGRATENLAQGQERWRRQHLARPAYGHAPGIRRRPNLIAAMPGIVWR
jgi:hypothetical protein